MLPQSFKWIVTAAFLGVALGGCFSGHPSLREELVNTGTVVIDPANPFVLGSQFLEAEGKKSELLKKFLEYRGRPSAIELRKPFFGSLKVSLFYLDRREVYLLDDGADDWIIRGPETIPAEVIASLQSAAAGSGLSKDAAAAMPEEGDLLEKDSLPSLRSSERKLNPLRSEIEQERVNKKSAAAHPPEDSEKVFEEIPEAKSLPEPEAGSEAPRQVAPNLQQEASGDLIHTVSFPGETLRIISSWYTGDPNSAGRVARINSIANPDRLDIGQTIRIPRYMLSKSQPLPEDEIARYNENLKSR